MNRNFRECGGQEVSGAIVLYVQDRVGIPDENDLGRLNEPDGIKERRQDLRVAIDVSDIAVQPRKADRRIPGLPH